MGTIEGQKHTASLDLEHRIGYAQGFVGLKREGSNAQLGLIGKAALYSASLSLIVEDAVSKITSSIEGLFGAASWGKTAYVGTSGAGFEATSSDVVGASVSTKVEKK